MGYSSHVGSFNIDTTKTLGQTQAVAGCGFTPKIVLFWWSGSTASSDTVAGGTYSYGFGAASSSTSRWCTGGYSTDNVGTSATQRSSYSDCAIKVYVDDFNYDGILDLNSMDADGFTLIVDDQFTSAYRISYLALGGTDLTNIKLGSFTLPAGTGEYDRTGVGFQPDLIITSSIGFIGDTYSAHNLWQMGMATSSSEQGNISIGAQDNIGTTNTVSYGYNGEVIGHSWVGSPNYRNSFVNFLADGFRFNDLEGTDELTVYYIALKGGQYFVGDLTTRTDGNDIAETVGFQPAALLFASNNRALSTQDTATDHARMSIGGASATDHRACAAISDEDNLDTTETAYANYDSAVYANILDDAIVGLMDLKSIESDGFTCLMDDTDPAGCWVMYLAIGAEELAESASVSPSISPSVSPSVSPSLSPSASESPSASPSVSPSLSPSASASPSAGISGDVCWGHETGVVETTILTFAGHWTGTGSILNGDTDAERIQLDPGEYMTSDVVETGTYTVELLQNHYDPTGDDAILSYRTADSEANCLLEDWVLYAGTFDSLGYVQIKVEMAA